MRQSRALEAQAAAASAAGSGSEDGEDGMATPTSHFSDSGSGEATPTFHDAEPMRPGVAAAAAAGSAEAADSLAPPEVRARVLSDAAAELLHDQLSERQRGALLAGASPSAAAAEEVAGGAEAEVMLEAAEDAGEGGPEGVAGQEGEDERDQMLAIYRMARKATQDLPGLQHQSSDVTLGQPTPRLGASQEEEVGTPGTLGTPATPSTGGFSFMLPSGSQQQRGLPQATPGMMLGGSGDGGSGAAAGLPPISEARRASQLDPHPHTGIRLSVARRLSEQAERRRSLHTPSTGGGSGLSAGSALRGSPFGSAAGSAGGTAGGSGGGHHPHLHHRVIELMPEDALPGVGTEEGVDVAVVKVLSTPCGMPPEEHTGARCVEGAGGRLVWLALLMLQHAPPPLISSNMCSRPPPALLPPRPSGHSHATGPGRRPAPTRA